MREADVVASDKANFFISYTSADQGWAEWIAWVLEEAGYQTVIQAWDFRPGREFVTEMQQALLQAQRVLAVLSPAYLDSAFARQEWNAALASDPTGTAGRLLPVRVAQVTLQGLDRPRIYVDLVGLSKEEAKNRLLAGVKADRAKPSAEPGYPELPGRRAIAGRNEDSAVASGVVDQEFQAHWDPRARGVASVSDPGWYFAGRTRVLRELVAWLGDPDLDHRARVITGGPGSGKSAVLARLVTLADPELRQGVPQSLLAGAPAGTVPPLASIDVAIHARNKTLSDVLAALGAAMGGNEPTAGAIPSAPEQQIDRLVNELLGRPRGRVVILDALDEADNPRQLSAQLLQRLLATASQCGLRLLVGTRRPLVETLGSRIVVLDLDDAAYFDEADLAEYVGRVLLAEHDPDQRTPYRGHPELAGEVARAVARRASPAFLIARMAARALATADHPLDISHPGWELRLPTTVGDAFEAYLERFGPNQQRARDLLSPVAFAEGAGLPGELWAQLARALSDTDDYTDEDVRWIRQAAAAYLTEVDDRGIPVYRLYHHALAEHLRVQQPGPEPHRRITQALRTLVPVTVTGQAAWDATHPYLRAHLASHAAAAGQLDDLLIDPGFLLSADPDRLLPALAAAERLDGQQAAEVYRSALYQLRGRPVPDAAAYLQLTACRYGANDVAERIGRLDLELPWSVPWAHFERAQSYVTIGVHTGLVSAIAVGELDDRSIAITGGRDDGTVRVWDLVGGAWLYQLTGHTGGVSAIAVTTLDGGPIAITGGYDDIVRVWDLGGGALLHQLTGHTGSIIAVAVGKLDNRPIAITGSYHDGTVRVWDITRGTQLGKPLRQRKQRIWSRLLRPEILEINALAVGELNGRPIAITGSDRDGIVCVWDLASGGLLHRLSGHPGGVRAVAVSDLDGRPIAITGGEWDGIVCVWDLASGGLLHQLTGHHKAGVNALAVTKLNGRPIAITGSREHIVRVWDLAGGAPLHRLTGHTSGVSVVAVGELDGRPIAITGSGVGDGTVRVWDLTREGMQANEGGGYAGEVKQVGVIAVSELDGRPIAITGSGLDLGRDSTVRVWDLDGGALLHQLTGHTGDVRAIAVGKLDNRPIAITGDEGSIVYVWDLAGGVLLHQLADQQLADQQLTELQLIDQQLTDQELAELQLTDQQLGGHIGPVVAISVTMLDGRPIAITCGESDSTVLVWDVADGALLHQLTDQQLADHIGGVNALAVGELNGRPIAIAGGDDGTVRVWDVADGALLHQLTNQQLADHIGGIRAAAVSELYGRPIAVSGGDQTVRVWDLGRGTLLYQLTSHTEDVDKIAVTSLDGRPIAITGGFRDETVCVWDLAGGVLLHQLTGHIGGITALEVSVLDDRPIAITGGYDDGTVRVWDLTRGDQLLVIELGVSVWELVVSRRSLVVAGTPMGIIPLDLLLQ